MKQTLLQATTAEYERKLKSQVIFCVVCAAVMVAINVALTAVRKDSNHTLMLILNIVIDVLALWFIYGFVSTVIVPKRRLLSLAKSTNHIVVAGQVTEIEQETTRVDKFDCVVITVQSEKKHKVFVVQRCGIKLVTGQKVTLMLSQNIVISAEVEQ